jgi:hypothetical protein
LSKKFSTSEITSTLRAFQSRRDDLLHEDAKGMQDYLVRFIKLCQNDAIIQDILAPLLTEQVPEAKDWIQKLEQQQNTLPFPDDTNEEFALRYKLIQFVANDPDGERYIWRIGSYKRRHKLDESIDLFRTLIIRPFVLEMTNRLAEVANLASPNDRAIQAVPLSRIPSPNEVKIFLSHKSVDKPLVRRYFNALQQAGFSPWMDENEMAAGASLERGILQGFDESCAAVFFVTENFKDEKYLATEVDYAALQKRNKEKKFVIITLLYSDNASVPSLLRPYVYKNISNDLEGFYEILRSLPIEMGPTRWKQEITE